MPFQLCENLFWGLVWGSSPTHGCKIFSYIFPSLASCLYITHVLIYLEFTSYVLQIGIQYYFLCMLSWLSQQYPPNSLFPTKTWWHLWCKPSPFRHLSLSLGSLCSSVDVAQLLYQCCTDFIAVTLLLIYVLIAYRVNPPTLCPFSFFFKYCLEGQSEKWSGVTPKLQVRFPDPYSTRENSRENEKGWILMEAGWRKSKDTMKVVLLSSYLAASIFYEFLKLSFSSWFVAATKQYL